MVSHSDNSESASKLAELQGIRLRRLRERTGRDIQQAAEDAGISRHSWGRQEKGETRIDTVALARFCKAHGLPAEYVITGSFAGLDSDLIRELLLVEQIEGEESARIEEHISSDTAGARPHRKRQKSSSGIAKRAAPSVS